MMKMKGRDSAEYQNWEMKGRNGHYGICLSHNKTKLSIVLLLQQKMRNKKRGEQIFGPVAIFERFPLERETSL